MISFFSFSVFVEGRDKWKESGALSEGNRWSGSRMAGDRHPKTRSRGIEGHRKSVGGVEESRLKGICNLWVDLGGKLDEVSFPAVHRNLAAV